ncbi:hypothetical protein [Bacillus sp. FSL K6-3431]|uniref:hypothetical protein n=1 Tax=Bacillus sp. FSL K6-3431 TaxID=2921500 RepID=UPI0030FA9C97
MKSAVVFGARQQYGFELCVKLLDVGCYVYAIDHENWQTDVCEERWMQIGRNAHVELIILNHKLSNKQPVFLEKIQYYMVPVIDYSNFQYDTAHKQMLQMLELYYKADNSSQAQFLFLHDLASGIDQSIFHQKLDSILDNMRQSSNKKLMEYFLPNMINSNPQAAYLLHKNEEKEMQKIDFNLLTDFSDVVMNHLEQMKIFQDNDHKNG